MFSLVLYLAKKIQGCEFKFEQHEDWKTDKNVLNQYYQNGLYLMTMNMRKDAHLLHHPPILLAVESLMKGERGEWLSQRGVALGNNIFFT